MKRLHRYVAEFNFRYSNRVALGYNNADRAEVERMIAVDELNPTEADTALDQIVRTAKQAK